MKKVSNTHIPLMGGLGNQLFQLAAGIYLQKKQKCAVNYPTLLLHPPKLLRGTKTSLRRLMISDLTTSSERQKLSRIKLLVWRFLPGQVNKLVIRENSFNDNILDTFNKNTRVLIGYFQRIKYVDSVKAELLAKFYSSETFKSLIPTSLEPRIAIHVRLGDYLSNHQARAFHGLSDISYFVDGAKILIGKLETKNILVVSDDPKLAKSMFEPFFEGGDLLISYSACTNEFEDLALLSHSAGLVASNSSFSWWAAWLSSPLGSKIVVPSPWFSELSKAEENLFDNRWIVVQRKLMSDSSL